MYSRSTRGPVLIYANASGAAVVIWPLTLIGWLFWEHRTLSPLSSHGGQSLNDLFLGKDRLRHSNRLLLGKQLKALLEISRLISCYSIRIVPQKHSQGKRKGLSSHLREE